MDSASVVIEATPSIEQTYREQADRLWRSVYAFAGADVTADDLDGATPEPYSTTGIVLNTDSGQFSYALRFLPAGDYTLALTCRGNEDELGADDELEFGDGVNVSIQADDVLQRNLS